MEKRSQNLEYCARLAERMRGAKNPAKRPEVRAKIRKGWDHEVRLPYGRGAGGKGRGKTTSEKEAWRILEPLRFVSEHRVLTGSKKGGGRATWYSLDFAQPNRKLAVEVDGSSHQNRAEVDERKDAFLVAHGWTVLRIPADLVLEARGWLMERCSLSRPLLPGVERFSTLR